MNKNWIISIVFLLASILVSLFSGNVKLDNTDAGTLIGELFGSVLVINIIPLIIILVINLARKRKEKEPNVKKLVSIYTVAWGIVVYLILYGSCSKSSNESTQNSYLYHPVNSEYSIVFGNTPKISQTTVPMGSFFLKGEVAEVNLNDGKTFERVEFYTLDKTYINSFNNDVITNFLTEYSRLSGLSYPEINFIENGTSKYAELKAYKEAAFNSDTKKNFTFAARVYIKGDSFFVTYVGADSKDFPTTDIVRFWDSLKNE